MALKIKSEPRHWPVDNFCLLDNFTEDAKEEKPDISFKKEEVSSDTEALDDEDVLMAKFKSRDADAKRELDLAALEESETVKNRCLFKCRSCGLVVKSWDLLGCHVKSCPSSGPRRLRKVLHFVHRALSYKCRECGILVLCDRSVIKSHVKRHGISLTGYLERNHRREFEEGREKMVLDRDPKLEEALEASPVSTSASSKCRFDCPACGYVCGSWSTFGIHARKCDERSKLPCRPSLLRFVSRLVAHDCIVCKRKLVCDTYFIACHAGIHGLSLSKYKQQIDANYEPRGNLKEKMLKSASVSCTIGDFCTFSCKGCKTTFGSMNGVTNHWRKTMCHKSADLWTSIYNSFVKAVKYFCPLCSNPIFCDRYLISKHARGVHKLTLDEYLKEAKLPGKFDITAHLSELARKHPVSESVDNKCRFKCTMCEQSSNSWVSMARHLNCTRHGGKSVHEYLKCLTKVIMHKCGVCSQVMLCDNFFISKHSKLHMKERNTGRKGRGQNCGSILRQYCDMGNVQSKHERMIENAPLCLTVANMCTYKCSVCSSPLTSSGEIRKHAKVCIGLKNKEVLTVLSCLHKPVSYLCPLCQKKVLCDKLFIGRHSHNYHRITMSQFMAKIRGLGSKMSSMNEWHNMSQNQVEEFAKNIPTYTPQERVSVKPGKIPESLVSTSCGNLCKFRCPCCDQHFFSWSTVLAHARKQHYIGHVTYRPHLVVTARYHQCHICKKVILCDNVFVLAHVRQDHKISRQSYLAKVREGGGRAIGNSRDRVSSLMYGSADNLSDASASKTQQQKCVKVWKLKPCRVVLERVNVEE